MFSRRWLINYCLVVLICLFTYIGNRYDVKTEYQPKNRITSLIAADIETLGLQTADESLKLRRVANNWQFESPIRWPANNINIERLLGITKSETQSRLSADDIDLATLGLQFPKAMLNLNDTRILFGGTNNIGERRYIMIDSTVYLLADIYFPFVSQGLLSMVDRRLLPASLKLKSLKLAEFELIRSTANNWQINGPARFSNDAINRLIDNWQHLEATLINRYDATRIPKQKILAELNDGSSHEFFVISISPEIIVANPAIGLQFHFNDSLYYQLISLRENENSES